MIKANPSQRHTFRQPAKPLEPLTPRGSLLGLDRLAKEKREQQEIENGSRKRPRTNDDGVFKGESAVSRIVCVF